MTLSSPKGLPGYLGFPRPLSSLLISIVGLALFLAVASRILISYPISSTIHEYITGLDNSRSVFFSSSGIDDQQSDTANESATDFERSRNLSPTIFPYFIRGQEANTTIEHGFQNATDKSIMPLPSSSGGIQDVKSVKGPITGNDINGKHVDGAYSIGPASNSNVLSSNTIQGVSESLNGTNMVIPPAQFLSGLSEKHDSGSCNLYHGRWVYDTAGPLYTNNTCPVITQMQNCRGNGRPDSDYENWRWKPDQCDLPRFDAKKFLQLMRGKTLAFVGDSVARNQMESLLCILWQVETPKNRGNRHMQRWFFRSTSTMIIRIWSSWLVHRTSAPVQFAPEGIDKLHLDAPDETFMEHLPMFDVLVLSSGHWFAKQSVYVLNGTIVGGQLWWPNKFQEMTVNNVEAFGISVETALMAISMHPNYTGLTIVRSFSPDHYEGGAWNTGGSCTGKVNPATEVVRNGFTDAMHEKQVQGFEKAALKVPSRSKLRLLDITEAFGYRHDGHPGPYRSPDPNKVTKRGPDGKPPPQDCLHWCMPGPVDTWNEFVLEIIRREFEKAPGA